MEDEGVRFRLWKDLRLECEVCIHYRYIEMNIERERETYGTVTMEIYFAHWPRKVRSHIQGKMELPTNFVLRIPHKLNLFLGKQILLCASIT